MWIDWSGVFDSHRLCMVEVRVQDDRSGWDRGNGKWNQGMGRDQSCPMRIMSLLGMAHDEPFKTFVREE